MISSGTDTRSPSLVLTHRMKMGLGFLSSPSPRTSSPMTWPPLRLVLLACFLRSLLIVSCYRRVLCQWISLRLRERILGFSIP